MIILYFSRNITKYYNNSTLILVATSFYDDNNNILNNDYYNIQYNTLKYGLIIIIYYSSIRIMNYDVL